MGLGNGLGLGLSNGAKASGAAPLTPSTVAGNVLYITNDVGVVGSAGKLVSWADQSASPKNTTVGSNSPNYTAGTGLGGGAKIDILATGTAILGATSIVASGADRTIFMVIQALAPGTVGDLICFKQGTPLLAVRYDTAGNTTGDESSFSNTGTYTSNTSPHVIEVTYSVGVASPYYIDGVLIAQAAPHVAVSDSGAAAGFNIGGAGPITAGTFTGQVAAALVYNSVLSAANRSTVRVGLGAKFGITVTP